ncbi:MAG: response regulator [Hormoscilla sp.]
MEQPIDTNDEAYGFFVQEALELLQPLESGLLTLSKEHDIKKIQGLMRGAHSIKGGAACVGLMAIGEIAHNLENAIRALYSEETVFDLQLEDLLLQAFDCLREPILAQIETGKYDASGAIARSRPVFEQLEAKLGHPLEEAAELPEMPVVESDITEFIFTEEVPQGLKRWENLLKDPTKNIEDLKAQAEVFSTLGDMLNLPGFVAIAQTTLKALDLNPPAVAEIAKLALADFRAAQQAVTKGDRPIEINPSPELLQLTQPMLSEKRSPPPTATQSATAKPDRASSITMSSLPQPPDRARSAIAQSLGVRVDISRLDMIGNLVGELVTQDNRFVLQNQENQATLESLNIWFNRCNKLLQDASFTGDNHEIVSSLGEEMAQMREIIQDGRLLNQQSKHIIKKREQTIKKIQNHLLSARMMPVESLLNRFPRMLRDLSARKSKAVKLELGGTKTLVDKAILEKLYDPLVHLLRNAFDHGIESLKIRETKGKPQSGTIKIKAYNRGNYTYIEVQDDGQGIDLEKIRSKAVAKQLINRDEARNLSERELYELMFTPGFSTAAQVSELSGRGVGLDAVRMQVEGLKGKVSVMSELGKGTKFTLRLPWTLTITKLLVFAMKSHLLAIPADTVTEIVAVAPSEIASDKSGQQIYTWQGRPVPIVESLFLTYRYPAMVGTGLGLGKWEQKQSWTNIGKVLLLILSQGPDAIALRLDRMLLEDTLAIKPFGKALKAPNYLYGCTILGDGSLVPVVDGVALVERGQETRLFSKGKQHTGTVASNETILVIDDSVTTRQAIAATLQKAGYNVITAAEGAEGLAKVTQNSAVRVVICDIEMPQMDGFQFLSRCRKQYKMDQLPVLMLTSRSSEKYRQLAKQLKANGYLTKPYLDRVLVSTVQKCLQQVPKP